MMASEAEEDAKGLATLVTLAFGTQVLLVILLTAIPEDGGGSTMAFWEAVAATTPYVWGSVAAILIGLGLFGVTYKLFYYILSGQFEYDLSGWVKRE